MAECNVVENHTGDKTNRLFGLPLKGRKIAPGLLGMHRWGAITAEQFAGLNGHAVSYTTKKLAPSLTKSGNAALMRVIRPTRDGFGPRPPYFYALTRAGYDHLCYFIDAYWNEDPLSAIGKFVPPVDAIHWDEMMPHRLRTIDVLNAIERQASGRLDGISIRNMLAEFRYWDGKRCPTAMRTPEGRRLKPDAMVSFEHGGVSWPDFIEIDMGTETITSENPKRVWETIEGKIRNYWSMMGSPVLNDRFKVNASFFRVLFVTTTVERARRIVSLAGDCGLMPVESGDMTFAPTDVFRAATFDQALSDFFGDRWEKPNGSRTGLVPDAAP